MSQEKIILKVYRYNPEVDEKPHYREYEVPSEGIQTLLDALFYIQENLDPTLSFRFFCRAAVCGSCAMKVNGISRLACKTPFKNLVERANGRPITVEPLNFLSVIKDLVVDHDKPFDNLKQLQIWCEPKQPIPKKEYRISPEEVKEYERPTNCILCFACYGSCEAVMDDPKYAGPFAFSRVFRYLLDSRVDEDHKRQMVKNAMEVGDIWGCVQCQKCIYVCPKGVRPAEDIQNIRGKAAEYGFKEYPGVKKLQHFVDWVYATGQINRLALPEEVYGVDPTPLINKFKERGAEVWEVPKPLSGLLEFRDLILEVMKEKKPHLDIDFRHVRRIDKKVEEVFNTDVCTKVFQQFEERREDFFSRFWKKISEFFGTH